MYGRKDFRRKFRRQNFASFACDAKRRPENRLSRRCAHGDHELWLNDSELCFQPWPAGCDFARIRFLMNAAFPTRFPLKMFHRIRDVYLGSINSSFFQRAIHDFAGRPDERFTGDVFVISRLFANEHQSRGLGALPKNGLRCSLVKMTRLAMLCCLAHGRPTCRVGRLSRARKLLIVRSHSPIINRNSHEIRVHYFQ